jgi:hypothetical protein
LASTPTYFRRSRWRSDALPPRIEIAAGRGSKPLWFPDALAQRRYLPYGHVLIETDFDAVRDHAEYTTGG